MVAVAQRPLLLEQANGNLHRDNLPLLASNLVRVSLTGAMSLSLCHMFGI